MSVATNNETPPISGAPADNRGWHYVRADGAIYIDSPGAVIDGIKSNGVEDHITGGNYTLKNSQIDGVISSYGTANGDALIENSTIIGGRQATYPTVGIPDVDVESSNLSGGKDEVNCEGNSCAVKNSWLHDNYTGDPTSHQQGFFAEGNTYDTLIHNSISCIGPSGQCTADVSILGYTTTNVSATNNLLLSSPRAGFCVYPGPDAIPGGITYNWANIVWTDNVFQKGSTGKCGYAGPQYGWYPSRCTPTSSCTWTGNVWDDGTALNEPFK